jgi:hypothetical protein
MRYSAQFEMEFVSKCDSTPKKFDTPKDSLKFFAQSASNEPIGLCRLRNVALWHHGCTMSTPVGRQHLILCQGGLNHVNSKPQGW